NRRGDRLVGRVRGGQECAVAVHRPLGTAKDGLGRSPSTAHRLRDALTLERVHEAGGVTREQDPATTRGRADHSHLEPTTEAGRHRGAGSDEDAETTQVVREGAESSSRARRARAVGEYPESEAEIGAALHAWEHP